MEEDKLISFECYALGTMERVSVSIHLCGKRHNYKPLKVERDYVV